MGTVVLTNISAIAVPECNRKLQYMQRHTKYWTPAFMPFPIANLLQAVGQLYRN
jgi:hypothetical protein